MPHPERVPFEVVNLEDRPDLREGMFNVADDWPEFMKHDPVSWSLGASVSLLPAFHLVGLLDGRPVAKGHSVPVPWDGTPEDLPDQGWDQVLGLAIRAATGGRRKATAVTALEINIEPGLRGQGLSALMVAGMRDNARRQGFADLVAPVRPAGKANFPAMSMEDYAARVREDGLPEDNWLRVHARLGGRVIKVCPASMAIAGSLAQWRAWTGLPFDSDDDVTVPGALCPVHVSTAHDHAVYIEANVWVHHRL